MSLKISALWLKPWSTIVGFILGASIVLFTPTWLAPTLEAWDNLFPVMSPVSSDVVDRFGDEMTVNIVAYKHRGDECRLIRLYGYVINAVGEHSLAEVHRPDGAHHAGIVHGEGLYDFGLWSVKPMDNDAVRVQVYVEHNCLGRVIKSLMAEAKLEHGVENE